MQPRREAQATEELAKRWAARGANLVDDGAAAREALEQDRTHSIGQLRPVTVLPPA